MEAITSRPWPYKPLNTAMEVVEHFKAPPATIHKIQQYHTNQHEQSSNMSGNFVVDALEAWNNFKDLEGCWKLYIGSYNKAVGYFKKDIKEAINWDLPFAEQFDLDATNKTITVKKAATANKAFEDMFDQNRGRQFFDEQTVDKWLSKKCKAREDSTIKRPDYHPIFTQGRPDLKDLKVPSPLRGITGNLTAGIHVNAYTTKSDKVTVDKIWVSKRLEGKAYGGCYDQIIAGGMEPHHNLDPWATFKQECEEESMYKLEGKKFKRVLKGSVIGEAEGPTKIYFFTDKIYDDRVGASEKDHIEPGVRFCFDVKIAEGEVPDPNPEDKSSSGFKALTVNEIKQSLKDGNWKPNCGLVMLDFLRRKDLLSAEEKSAVMALDSPSFGLPVPDFKEEM